MSDADLLATGSEPPDLPIVTIVGETVALGPVCRELLPDYQRWMNNLATVARLSVLPGPVTEELELEWFDGAATGSSPTFTIYERATWRPIGNTALHDVDFRNRAARFGILIGEPTARNQGFGTEATRLMLDYAFTALGLHNVMLSVYEFNLAGQRTYAKAGFKEIGRRRQCRWLGGRLWDEILMDCLATEFTSPVLSRMLIPDHPRAPGDAK